MSVTTLIGAAIGAAIDGSDGDDSNLDGAIGGAIAAKVVTAVIPLALTFATGWFVLRGIGKLKDEVFGTDEPVRRLATDGLTPPGVRATSGHARPSFLPAKELQTPRIDVRPVLAFGRGQVDDRQSPAEGRA